MKTLRRKQRGFTLVELSIVLVIIGLIIGGVLTGQQIIQNARITNALNAIQAYQAQFQTYAQNFGALPGNDSNATTRFPGMGVANGDGLGTLHGFFDAPCVTGSTTESCLVWADLRAAGLVKNQAIITQQPPNPFNGRYGFQSGAFGNNFTSIVLCLDNIPGTAAQTLDTRLDDGVGDTGSVQSMISGAAGAPGPAVMTYDASQTYTMCIRM